MQCNSVYKFHAFNINCPTIVTILQFHTKTPKRNLEPLQLQAANASDLWDFQHMLMGLAHTSNTEIQIIKMPKELGLRIMFNRVSPVQNFFRLSALNGNWQSHFLLFFHFNRKSVQYSKNSFYLDINSEASRSFKCRNCFRKCSLTNCDFNQYLFFTKPCTFQ